VWSRNLGVRNSTHTHAGDPQRDSPSQTPWKSLNTTGESNRVYVACSLLETVGRKSVLYGVVLKGFGNLPSNNIFLPPCDIEADITPGKIKKKIKINESLVQR
jgi:hypothetical protein